MSIFLLAMGCLVMGDNLLTLASAGKAWAASYMLIGYHYKPSAVAAARKPSSSTASVTWDWPLAFISPGCILARLNTASCSRCCRPTAPMAAAQQAMAGGWEVAIIPFLLMAGAFGKSAQLPFYVWLPDAMEGPLRSPH